MLRDVSHGSAPSSVSLPPSPAHRRQCCLVGNSQAQDQRSSSITDLEGLSSFLTKGQYCPFLLSSLSHKMRAWSKITDFHTFSCSVTLDFSFSPYDPFSCFISCWQEVLLVVVCVWLTKGVRAQKLLFKISFVKVRLRWEMIYLWACKCVYVINHPRVFKVRDGSALTVLKASTGNSVQYYVTAWMGGEFGGEWIQVYVWLSCFVIHLKLSQYY